MIKPSIKFLINLSECEIFDQYEKTIKFSDLKENSNLILTLKNNGFKIFSKKCL